jgi:predicted dehydrogenase
MTTLLEMVIVGAGHRSRDSYGPYAEQHPDEVRIVAVAEPNPLRRRQMAERFDFAGDMCFESWQDLVMRPQLAPALLNLTQDRTHVESTIVALERGYHILLEKQMAQTPAGCARLVHASERTG